MRMANWWFMCRGLSTLHSGCFVCLAWDTLKKSSVHEVSPASHITLQRTRTDRNKYHMSRQFVPPGRLMYLRPVKAKCKEKKLERRYHAVWIEAAELQVGPCSSALNPFCFCLGSWRVAAQSQKLQTCTNHNIAALC